MIIHLPKDVERSIVAAVDSGYFPSADDALVAAWRVLEQTKLGQVPADNKAKRARPTRQKKPLNPDELNQRLLASGRITRLPDPAEDIDDDDPDDLPVTIKGEPLSETIIRERR